MSLGLAGIPHTDFALRVFLALAFGSLIGLERQWRQRLAGLRTNALVATGACLFVLITPLTRGSDSTQIAAYVVSGIGFLAGGVIFKERLSVSGLNTAATLWCTAAIGALLGYGFLIDAGIGVVAILAANTILRPVVRRINRQPIEGSEIISSYEVSAVCGQAVEERVRAAMIAAVRAAAITLTALYSDDVELSDRVTITADVTAAGRPDDRLEKIVTTLGADPSIVAVSWKVVPTNEDERELVADV